MATTGERLDAAHRALKRASEKIREQEQSIQALEGMTERLQKDLTDAEDQIRGFADLVKELSRSTQRAAQANYRSLDHRLTKLENRERVEDTEDTGTAI